MRRNGFTLLETIVSISILFLVTVFLSQAMSDLRLSKKSVDAKISAQKRENSLVNALYYDLMGAKDIKISGSKNYSVLLLKTKNSLYDIDMPYVVWYVSKKGNTLCRMESAKKYKLPIAPEDSLDVFVSKVVEGIKIFKIYRSKDKKSYMVFLKNDKNNIVTFAIKAPNLAPDKREAKTEMAAYTGWID